MIDRLKRRFNIQDDRIKEMVAENIVLIKKMGSDDASKKSTRNRDYVKRANGVCGSCGGENVVNKILRGQGSGSISGDFVLTFGSISGKSTFDTNPVNHCNDCGNQWNRVKGTYTSESDCVRETLNNLAYYMTSGDKNMHHYQGTFDELFHKEIKAEALWELYKKDNSTWSVRARVTLKMLREHLKSAFDWEKIPK